jgi:hypothetical protein
MKLHKQNELEEKPIKRNNIERDILPEKPNMKKPRKESKTDSEISIDIPDLL